MLPAAARAFGDQRPLVLGDGTADLQEKLIMRLLGHWTIQKLHLTAVLLQFLDQQDLVDVVAGQAIRVGDVQPVEGRQRGPVAEPVESRAAQAGAAVAVVAEDVVVGQPLAPPGDVGPQPLNLLLDGLGLSLSLGRDADVDRAAHG